MSDSITFNFSRSRRDQTQSSSKIIHQWHRHSNSVTFNFSLLFLCISHAIAGTIRNRRDQTQSQGPNAIAWTKRNLHQKLFTNRHSNLVTFNFSLLFAIFIKNYSPIGLLFLCPIQLLLISHSYFFVFLTQSQGPNAIAILFLCISHAVAGTKRNRNQQVIFSDILAIQNLLTSLCRKFAQRIQMLTCINFYLFIYFGVTTR